MPQRRGIFLINKKFQLRFAFYVCSWLLALSFIYPSLIYTLFDYFVRYVSLDPMGPDLARLQGIRAEMIRLLVFLQALFLCVTLLVSVFLSHRIAGPLHKLRLFLEAAKDGNFGKELHFRKYDHFKELAHSFNGLRSTVIRIPESVVPRLEKILPQTSGEARAELEKALEELRSFKA